MEALAAERDRAARAEADALALVPTLEGLTVREDNHFTEDHALAAIEAYYDPIIHKLTRERIERRTAIELPKNKRNGRKQAVHLARARTVQEFDDPDGAWRNKDGAPTKADLVREYAAEHPDANHSEIARALGISRPTVIKWLREGLEVRYRRPAGWCMVRKRARSRRYDGAEGRLILACFAFG